MPLANIGSLVLDSVVFLLHLVYVQIALSHAEPSQIFLIHLLSSLGNRRADSESLESPQWPPRSVVPL